MKLRFFQKTVIFSFTVILIFVFATTLILPIVTNAGQGKDKKGQGQHKVEVCHITGTYDFEDGKGEVPIGHVINIAESALQAHIRHGDPETWELVTLADGSEVCRESPPPGMTYKTPDKLERKHAENTLEVRFIFMSDSHFSEDFGDNIHEHHVASNIQETCDWFTKNNLRGCTGIVSGGDMVAADSDYDKMIDQFRTAYETGYHHQDWTVKHPVFLGIGNHDDYSEFKDKDKSHAELSYTYRRDRMKDSSALFRGKDKDGNWISNYYTDDKGYSDLYAWEWGNFHFIHMGLWAFYGGYNADYQFGDRATVNRHKITWLQEHLKAIGKEKPIVLIQHFGWDDMSLGDTDPTWWSYHNIDLLGDVLCDRDVKPGGSDEDPCDNPYNILGIFSGHVHHFKYYTNTTDDPEFIKGACGEGKYSRSKNEWTTCNEYLPFANYVVDDAGANDNSGYFHVLLQLDADGQGKMTVNKVKLEHWNDDTGYSRSTVEPWKTKDFTSNLFLRFDQGQPNDYDGKQDCALIKSNGRYNDYYCWEKKRLLCKDKYGTWHLSNGEYKWRDGFEKCEASDWQFTEPKSISEQAAIVELLAKKGISEAWINYGDWGKEGEWQEFNKEAIALFMNFAAGNPNNGDDRFEKGWGQNCVAIMRNLSLHDFPCEQLLDHYLCKDSGAPQEWTAYYATDGAFGARTGDWTGGYYICENKGLDYEGPALDDFAAFDAMKDAAGEYFGQHPEVRAMWVGINDLDLEGSWTIDKPWIAIVPPDNVYFQRGGGWTSGQPNGQNVQNCAVLTVDGWHDTECVHHVYGPWPFACRNYETGEWKITADTRGKNWIDGFEACRTEFGLRYHFATPMTKDANTTLANLRTQKGIETVWLNYTDADSDSGEDLEGFWRHGYWKWWMEGEPNNYNNSDCVLILGGPIGEIDGFGTWHDYDCATPHDWFCRKNEDDYPHQIGDWRSGSYKAPWNELMSKCPDESPGSLIAYPTCPSEALELQYRLGEAHYWSPFNDIYHEGFFTPY